MTANTTRSDDGEQIDVPLKGNRRLRGQTHIPSRVHVLDLRAFRRR
jgi:hypothetical protein